MKRIGIIVLAVLIPSLIFLGILNVLSKRHAGLAIKMPSTVQKAKPPPPVCQGRTNISKPFFGAAENNPAVNKKRVKDLTGLTPDVISFYTAFGAPYDEKVLCGIGKTSVPLIQWNPRKAPISAILAGKYDRYMQKYAQNLARYRGPVILSFGHEMNGSWYTWGAGHVKPEDFRSAWQRIHYEMRSAGNIIWLWNPNHLSNSARSLKAWYPGNEYVDLIGLDGYYRGPFESFDRLFGPSLRELHRIAPLKPVILAEVGVRPRPQLFTMQVSNLFRGVKLWGLTGVIWFDINAKAQWAMNKTRGTEIRKAVCRENRNVCSTA